MTGESLRSWDQKVKEPDILTLFRLTAFTSSRRLGPNLPRFDSFPTLNVLYAAACAAGSNLVLEAGIAARVNRGIGGCR
jgi:hypothetical protein